MLDYQSLPQYQHCEAVKLAKVLTCGRARDRGGEGSKQRRRAGGLEGKKRRKRRRVEHPTGRRGSARAARGSDGDLSQGRGEKGECQTAGDEEEREETS